MAAAPAWPLRDTALITANRLAFIARQEYVLLEIRVPRDVRKTPLAMEAVFSALHLSPGNPPGGKRVVLGAVAPLLVLRDSFTRGRVHLYVRTRAGFRAASRAISMRSTLKWK